MAVLVCGLLLWQCAAHFFSYQDDAFIFFRYAENLSQHGTLEYNIGERVEGFSSPLWVLALAAMDAVGVNPVYGAGIVGTLLMLVTLLLTVWDARRCGLPFPFTWLAPLGLVASFNFTCWAVAGMDVPLFTCLLWAALVSYRGALVAGRRPGLTCGLLLAAAGLARPEGALAVVVLGGAELVHAWRDRRLGWGAAARVLLPSLVAGAGLLLARWAYYGDLLPNTFFAKGGASPEHTRLGLEYLYGFVTQSPLALAVPLLLVGLAMPRRRPWRVSPAALPCVLLALLHAAHVVRVGGDFYDYFRYLVPLLPLLYALGTSAAYTAIRSAWEVPASWTGRTRRRVRVLAGGGVLSLVLVLQYHPFQFREHHGFPWTLNCSKLGRVLAARFQPGTSIALPHIGAVGYYSRLPVVDLLGLVDRDLARGPSGFSRLGWPLQRSDLGHEKFNVQHSLARRPQVVIFSRSYGSRPFTHGSEIPRALALERRMQEILSGRSDYLLANIRYDRDAHWAVFVHRDLKLTAPREGKP